MREFTPEAIVSHRFASGRKRGYDALEVDTFLAQVAEYVGWMQGELAQHHETERTALDMLSKARRVADETVGAAQRHAETIELEAAERAAQVQAEADDTLQDARVKADKIVLSAQVRAEADVQRSLSTVAENEAVGVARLHELERRAEKLKSSVAESTAELRFAGLRILELAERYDSELPEHAPVDDVWGGSHELRENVETW